jgi:hypothetical protein
MHTLTEKILNTDASRGISGQWVAAGWPRSDRE